MTLHNDITIALESLRPIDPDLVSDALLLLESFIAEERAASSGSKETSHDR